MHCGQLLAAAAPAVPSGMPAAAPALSPKRSAWPAVVAGAVAFALLVFALNEAGVLKLGGRIFTPAALQAEGAMSTPGTLQAQGSTGPPTLPVEASHRVMPDDVRRWLEHLERIEKRRVSMSETHLAQAMGMMVALQAGGSIESLQSLLQGEVEGAPPTPSPVETTTRDIDAMRVEWNALTDDFNSVSPPQECLPIRNAYDQVVRETGAMIMDILDTVGQAEQDRTSALAKLMGMQGRSESRIGEPASKTDRLIQEVCDKYDTRKWFSVTRDVGGGGLLKGGSPLRLK